MLPVAGRTSEECTHLQTRQCLNVPNPENLSSNTSDKNQCVQTPQILQLSKVLQRKRGGCTREPNGFVILYCDTHPLPKIQSMTFKHCSTRTLAVDKLTNCWSFSFTANSTRVKRCPSSFPREKVKQKEKLEQQQPTVGNHNQSKNLRKIVLEGQNETMSLKMTRK